ncbi:MAG: MarR family winged helix-turn-helix transcriptional regulator [Lachnospiraceae bacterium]|nr:MarR family winged helix-turn-helix transcriptional regulator [Lachnospiraceae bacterium]
MPYKKMLGFEIRLINNLIKGVVSRTHPDTGVRPQTQLQAGILGYLYHKKEQPVYQKNIEEVFNISGATATNTLRVMERNGLLTRCAMDKDARLKRIMLTEPAKKGHRLAEAHMEMMEEEMMQGLERAEREELLRLLAVVRENLERMNRETEECGN